MNTFRLPVYMDYNATTPCDERVVEAMLPYFSSDFGNAASRNHFYGRMAEEAVNNAREKVAQLIGAEANEIIFTSGATESDNLAIKGAFEAYVSKGNHIITCSTEHKAVLDTCLRLEKLGAEVTYLPVNLYGSIDLEQLRSAIRSNTTLIAIMYANNETGTIQPIEEISRIAKEYGLIFFSDAAQAVGKIKADVNKDGIDLMALTAHKMYGPKGSGALYVRRKNPRVKIYAQINGGGHEKNMRSGTLNVPGIVGFGKACEIALNESESEGERLLLLRDKLENNLLKIEETYLNGNKSSRLPHVTNISFRCAGNILAALNNTVAVSSGSACTTALPEPSHVLKAMGVSDELSFSSIRFALGRRTTEADVNYVIDEVTQAVQNLRENVII